MTRHFFTLSLLFCLTSIKGQVNDIDFHKFIIGDWYTIEKPDTNFGPDSVYREFAFLETYCEFFDRPNNFWIGNTIPFYEIKNNELIGYSDSSRVEIRFRAQISILGSDKFILQNDSLEILFYKLITDEYTLSQNLNDIKKSSSLDLELPVTSRFQLQKVFEYHYMNCFIRRELLHKLERNEITKDLAIEYINRIKYIDKELTIYEEKLFSEFTKKINELY